MKKYEVVRDVYSPCAPDTCQFLELELDDPERYIRQLFEKDKSAQVSSTEKGGSLIVEVVCEAAQRHRYTFTEI